MWAASRAVGRSNSTLRLPKRLLTSSLSAASEAFRAGKSRSASYFLQWRLRTQRLWTVAKPCPVFKSLICLADRTIAFAESRPWDVRAQCMRALAWAMSNFILLCDNPDLFFNRCKNFEYLKRYNYLRLYVTSKQLIKLIQISLPTKNVRVSLLLSLGATREICIQIDLSTWLNRSQNFYQEIIIHKPES